MMQEVYGLTFCMPITDEAFPNIGWSFNYNTNDDVIVGIMRAILGSRVEQAHVACLGTCYMEYFRPEMTEVEKLHQLGAEEYVHENTISIVNFRCNNASDVRTYEQYWNIDSFMGMTRDRMLEQKIKSVASGIKIFNSKSEAKTLILTCCPIYIPVQHAIAIGIPRFFAKYFEDKPLTEREMEIIRCLPQNDRAKFVELMETLANELHLQDLMLEKSLSGFENRYIEASTSRLKRQLEEVISELNDINNRYASFMRDKRKYERELRALQLEAIDDKNELLNYFKCNNNLHLISRQDSALTFAIKTKFKNFDSDGMREMLDMPNHAERCDMWQVHANPEDVDMLYKALMIDEKIDLWLEGKFTINADYADVSADRRFDYCGKFANTMKNPHLYWHGCMGDNRRYAIEAVAGGDYVSAIEQAIGSVASINIHETVTSRPWAQQLFQETRKCFETKDGRFMNTKEVIEYLKKEVYINE